MTEPSHELKTCKRGHLKTPENSYICGGYAKCKKCIEIYRANHLKEKKAYNHEYKRLPGFKRIKEIDLDN